MMRRIIVTAHAERNKKIKVGLGQRAVARSLSFGNERLQQSGSLPAD
jgi:hypothetical protein